MPKLDLAWLFYVLYPLNFQQFLSLAVEHAIN
jgi:hypothetical protein